MEVGWPCHFQQPSCLLIIWSVILKSCMKYFISGFYLRNCINCIHNCEDHSLLDGVLLFHWEPFCRPKFLNTKKIQPALTVNFNILPCIRLPMWGMTNVPNLSVYFQKAPPSTASLIAILLYLKHSCKLCGSYVKIKQNLHSYFDAINLNDIVAKKLFISYFANTLAQTVNMDFK